MSEWFYDDKPVFKNGAAQPVFRFTDGKTGDKYSAKESSVVRYCVYVETDFDMDGDGRRDLVKALVQVPRSAVIGKYKAATIFEARPYCAGIQEDGYDHMKEVSENNYPDVDLSAMSDSPAPRIPKGIIEALDASEEADPSDWYYKDKGSDSFCYENLDAYNYYLVRGFAVVLSAGIGTFGSDGFEYVGSDFERDGFKAVVEWLHGDRIAFADKDCTMETKADWSNGNVGMTGRSYAGTMPFAVATTGVPGLQTIVPVAGIADWYSFLNQQGAQRYWPAEMLMSFLAYFCSSRYNDESLSTEELDKISAFHHRMSMDQLRSGCDYSDFWDQGNYTLDSDGIKCSALIVHGLNDENVSTKQFEMMLDAFERAGKNVKLIIHQGQHMTPTMANKKYGIKINGEDYDEILNRWFSHYLYGIENGAEAMPVLTVQSNVNQKEWYNGDSWKTDHFLEAQSVSSGSTVIDTNWKEANISEDNFDEKMSMLSSNMNVRYLSDALADEIVIQGSVKVSFAAALSEGDAKKAFNPQNINDADSLTAKLTSYNGRQDDVKLTVLLCDVSENKFNSIQTVDPQRNNIPVRLVNKESIRMGGDLTDFDEVEFEEVSKNYKVITRAYIDMCNPESGYDPRSAANSIELQIGEYHDYNAYLNATRYIIKEGHRLALVIGTEDPVNCLVHKEYKAEIEDDSVRLKAPIVSSQSVSMDLSK